MSSSFQTSQQQRARAALEAVEGFRTRSPEERRKLKSRASELPFMVHANGLGQAAAFFRSKRDKDGYGDLFKVLADWLISEGRPFEGRRELMEAITQCDLHTYRRAQAEAMQYMDWVKKFVNATLED